MSTIQQITEVKASIALSLVKQTLPGYQITMILDGGDRHYEIRWPGSQTLLGGFIHDVQAAVVYPILLDDPRINQIVSNAVAQAHAQAAARFQLNPLNVEAPRQSRVA